MMKKWEEKIAAEIKRIITEAGGIYVGFQEGTETVEGAVLFTVPTTRTTLAMRINEITAERVRETIEQSTAKFKETK